MKECYYITFISTDDCFFYLNEKNADKLMRDDPNNHCIKIQFGENFSEFIFSSLSNNHKHLIRDDSIGVNSIYANLLGFKENDCVLISRSHVPSIRKVYVRPREDVQYGLIEENFNFLESNLLNKVNVIGEGQTIPILLYSNIVIYLTVEKLEPKSLFGQIQQCTELVVLHPSVVVEADESSSKIIDDNAGNVLKALPVKLLDWLNQLSVQSKTDLQNGGHNVPVKYSFINQLLKVFFHHIDNRTIKYDGDIEKECLSTGFQLDKLSTYKICPISSVKCKISEEVLNKFILADYFPTSKLTDGPCCYKIFCKIRKVEQNIEGKLVPSLNNERKGFNPYFVFAYVVCVSDKNDNKFSNNVYCPDHIMKKLDAKLGAIVEIEEVKCSRVSAMPGNHINIQSKSLQTESENLMLAPSIKNIFQSVIKTITDNTRLNQKINILVAGPSGSGKTYLVDSVLKFFQGQFFLVCKVECKTLRKMKIAKLKKFLTEKLRECCKFQPSIFVMDDLDALLIEDGEEDYYSAMYSERIGNLINSLIFAFQKINQINFIATCSSLPKLKLLSTDRGPLNFENIHEITELDTGERAFVLKLLISQRFSRRCDVQLINGISGKTKGYTIQDLKDLVEMAAFKSSIRNGNNAVDTCEISQLDFESALSVKVPLSLSGVNLQKNIPTKWGDIGGMEATKRLLTETFAWPLRYPQVYKSCPLRLQCGVLLYGAPGTGKTLIAGAVANECGLNFISVKGPEIFSKYVGESEEGVRSLFARAKMSKPCLLFFDEFDSLVPRRGSSNEAVNDRVVNQMLTELDGVEELTGVFVLAATSRPDLLDPALLRPGRVDKAVHCALPNKEERLLILKCLSKNVAFSADINLEQIAARSEGYTGADLQAVLYAAQTSLVKEVEKGDRAFVGRHHLKLNQSHLCRGLAETKPSISKEDKLKYESIYETFVSSRTGGYFEQPSERQRRLMFS